MNEKGDYTILKIMTVKERKYSKYTECEKDIIY